MTPEPTTTSAGALTGAEIGATLAAFREVSPLVHCLTNVVVAQWTANVVLAAGGAPAMVDNPHEAGEFARVPAPGGVLVNLGTPQDETVAAMRLAAAGAIEAGRPWVLDPVAAGGLGWRTSVAGELLALGPSILRGNASEIGALAGERADAASTARTPPSRCWTPPATSPAPTARSWRSADRSITSPTASAWCGSTTATPG